MLGTDTGKSENKGNIRTWHCVGPKVHEDPKLGLVIPSGKGPGIQAQPVRPVSLAAKARHRQEAGN